MWNSVFSHAREALSLVNAVLRIEWHYCSEEDQEAILPGNLLPQGLMEGVSHRTTNQTSVDAGLAAMLQDERTLLGRRAAGVIDLDGTSLPVFGGVVKYQFLSGSYRATGEVPLEEINTVPAFTWVFAIKEVLLTMSCGAIHRDQHSRWRLCVYPPRQVVQPVRAPMSNGFPGPGVLTTSTAPLVDGLMEEDLNDPVLPGAILPAVGLSKFLCWGDLAIVVQGDSVVLPFATEEKAEAIRSWLAMGAGIFTWEYLLTVMSIGLFHVDVISNNST